MQFSDISLMQNKPNIASNIELTDHLHPKVKFKLLKC